MDRCCTSSAVGVRAVDGVVHAVGEHIEAQQAVVGIAVLVRIDKSANDGVVITALEVIEARLIIVVIATVADQWLQAEQRLEQL